MGTLGHTQSEETRQKISAAMKGRKRAPRAAKAPEGPINPGRPVDQRTGREL